MNVSNKERKGIFTKQQGWQSISSEAQKMIGQTDKKEKFKGGNKKIDT